jgi:glycerophosphoryl diester phosphodiesterase
MNRLTVFGHRGAAGLAPENTLASFDAAVAVGVPWVELDVQRCADALLVFHDDRLERTTNGQGRLQDHSLASLRALDAGNGQRIPLLEEVLDHLRGRVRINVELKSFNGTAALTADLLLAQIGKGTWQSDDFLVSSFHLPELARFHTLAPRIPIATLHVGPPLGLCAEARALEACAVHLAQDFVDARMIADARRSGLRVNAYTVNHADEAARLQAMGVDGIFTDHPERFIGGHID